MMGNSRLEEHLGTPALLYVLAAGRTDFRHLSEMETRNQAEFERKLDAVAIRMRRLRLNRKAKTGCD